MIYRLDTFEQTSDLRRKNLARECNVLLVDDHYDTCEALQRMLEARGVSTQFVLDPDAAIDFLKGHTPEVIVLDDMMPGKTGVELLKELKEDPRLNQIKVIFYSAVFDFDRKRVAEQLGASDWMVKGTVRMSDIADRVVELCG